MPCLSKEGMYIVNNLLWVTIQCFFGMEQTVHDTMESREEERIERPETTRGRIDLQLREEQQNSLIRMPSKAVKVCH